MGLAKSRQPEKVIARNTNRKIGIAILQSYGAMNAILDKLGHFEVLYFQHVNRWQYEIGVGRCQVTWRFNRSNIFYFPIHD